MTFSAGSTCVRQEVISIAFTPLKLNLAWSVFYASLSMGREGEVEGGNRYMLTTWVVQCLVGP